MLLVRRRAPDGSYFVDGDRAAGVFGVLATGFAILAGFVVVLAFQSYDASRTGAQAEARIVAHQFETAQLLPQRVRARLSGDLVCYARSVVHQEWPRMMSHPQPDAVSTDRVAAWWPWRRRAPSRAQELRQVTSNQVSLGYVPAGAAFAHARGMRVGLLGRHQQHRQIRLSVH